MLGLCQKELKRCYDGKGLDVLECFFGDALIVLRGEQKFDVANVAAAA